ncbi:hypothetical protein RAA17_08240 [Komagataeibacter rhaeticus]|nr:hypothetical protein [Komagataeibacter rhaeticus]
MLIGGVLVLEPGTVPFIGNALPAMVMRLAGVLLWGGVIAYVVMGHYVNEVKIWRWQITFPSSAMAVMQTVVAALEVAATATIAYTFLPVAPGLDYGTFLAIYIASYTAGLVASVPGGLGVFDGTHDAGAGRLCARDPYRDRHPDLPAVLLHRAPVRGGNHVRRP